MSETRTDWMARAACAGDLQFLTRPVAERHLVCDGCPVKSACLEFGLAQRGSAEKSHDLTFGGLSGQDLGRKARSLRRNPNRKADAAAVRPGGVMRDAQRASNKEGVCR